MKLKDRKACGLDSIRTEMQRVFLDLHIGCVPDLWNQTAYIPEINETQITTSKQ